MFAFTFLCYWWLQNDGTTFNGLAGEDINWTGHYAKKYNGTGVYITVVADGARKDHASIRGRTDDSFFINAFLDETISKVEDPEENWIGQASIMLSGGTAGVCGSTGIATNSKINSIYFYNARNVYENLQHVVCYNHYKTDVYLLSFQLTNCQDRFCRYIEPKKLPFKYATTCLYSNTSQRIVPIVVPAGNGNTSDILFSPPGRWPMVFSIMGINNRGVPLNHGAEGTGIFMGCPVADIANIPAASPINESACIQNFTSTNASAAIFAGGLAVLLNVNRQFTVADLFFITAMTADKTSPDSQNWESNGFGLTFSRRFGYGRLNLGRAVELAEKWSTVGRFECLSIMHKDANIPLVRGEPNVTFVVPEDSEYRAVIDVELKLTGRNIGFGSLNPHVISPMGTRCEMKILSESDLELDIREMEFPSYKFLGEDPRGTWTVIFKETDDADRGLLCDVGLDLYCTKKQPDPKLINRRNAANPWEPSTETGITFNATEPFSFVAGTSWSVNITVNKDFVKKTNYLAYLEDETQHHRVKIKAYYNADFTQITLKYVPSVFADGMKMYFVVESVEPQMEYTARLELNYTNNYPVGIISPKNMTSIQASQKDIEIYWSLHLRNISDDGYSTSAAVSIVSVEARKILMRTFTRNLGYHKYENALPSDKTFGIQVSPSSSDRLEQFTPMTIYLNVVEEAGNYKPAHSPFTLGIMIFTLIAFLFVFVAGIYRILFLSCIKKTGDGDESTLLDSSTSVH